MSYKASLIKKGLIVINSIFLIIIILFTPLSYYVFNLDFYLKLYESNGVFSNLNKEDIVTLTRNLFIFFKYGKPLQRINLKSNINFFTSNEINHLKDVRILLSKIFILYYASIILIIIFTAFLIERDIFKFIKNIGYISVISSTIVILILVFFYLFGQRFDELFENFHLTFFPQGNYAFPQNSLIITLFPFGFFYDFFKRLVLSSLIMSVSFLTVGIISIKLPKTKNQ